MSNDQPNAYEARQAARKARYEDRAAKAAREGQQSFDAAHDIGKHIPFGQPILVGHHSEKRHRRDIKRIDNAMRKGIDLTKKAEHYDAKAASVGKGGISSDDPEAIDKLRAQLADAEERQANMKATNALVRKKDRSGLIALGYTSAHVDDLLTPDLMGRVGFPAYALTNNNANIKRLRDRIADLEKRQTQESTTIKGDGWTYTESADENRVMFIFDGKPSDEVRQVLKFHAFHWSPSRGAWVRKLTGSGTLAGRLVRQKLTV